MLNLKLQYFGHLMQRTDSFEKMLMLGKIEGKFKRVQQRMRLLDCITTLMDMSFSKVRELVMDREAWRVAVHGVSKSRTRVSQAGQEQSLGSEATRGLAPVERWQQQLSSSRHLPGAGSAKNISFLRAREQIL